MDQQVIAEAVQKLAILFPPFLVAVIFHEFAHGFMAKHWGDRTAESMGRLTLNPLPHIDVIGTVALPAIMLATGAPFLFGWAKPVPIDPRQFRKYRPGLFWVAFAGPMMNFFMAFVSAAVLVNLGRFMSIESFYFEPANTMLYYSIILNFALGLFNMIPLPPLDGSKMVESVLSYDATRKYEAIAQYSFWILLALIFTGAIRIIFIPIEFLTRFTLGAAALIFQVSPGIM